MQAAGKSPAWHTRSASSAGPLPDAWRAAGKPQHKRATPPAPEQPSTPAIESWEHPFKILNEIETPGRALPYNRERNQKVSLDSHRIPHFNQIPLSPLSSTLHNPRSRSLQLKQLPHAFDLRAADGD